jgi:hypothetical protein
MRTGCGVNGPNSEPIAAYRTVVDVRTDSTTSNAYRSLGYSVRAKNVRMSHMRSIQGTAGLGS